MTDSNQERLDKFLEMLESLDDIPITEENVDAIAAYNYNKSVIEPLPLNSKVDILANAMFDCLLAENGVGPNGDFPIVITNRDTVESMCGVAKVFLNMIDHDYEFASDVIVAMYCGSLVSRNIIVKGWVDEDLTSERFEEDE